jgi:catechol 2,3-dioxygenase-like lactoylglutathione lyase family enzyme
VTAAIRICPLAAIKSGLWLSRTVSGRQGATTWELPILVLGLRPTGARGAARYVRPGSVIRESASGRTWRNSGKMARVPSRIAVIAIDAVHPRLIAHFWCNVLGWHVVEEDDGGVSIASPDGAWPTIDVFGVAEGKAVKNRLHLDLRADGVATPDELERLLSLGARRVDVGQGPDVSWVVLADPEGNEFCLLSRSVQEVVEG